MVHLSVTQPSYTANLLAKLNEGFLSESGLISHNEGLLQKHDSKNIQYMHNGYSIPAMHSYACVVYSEVCMHTYLRIQLDSMGLFSE